MDSVTLRAPSTGATAKVLVGFGFNCFQYRVPHAGEHVDVLWSEEGFEQGQKRPSGSGIPILFPFPGRIAGTTFHWEGREYPLEEGDGRGNAIHGFVLNRPWRVVEQSETRVAGQFQASQDDPALLGSWPADFRITASYEISAKRLESKIQIENPDDKPLPCGLGTHPYFRLPLGGRSADQCVVQLPVGAEWQLQDMLPTGRRNMLENPEQYAAGLKFHSMQFDHVFTELRFDGPRCRAAIHDPDGAALKLEFDRTFRECVVYTPPHRQAVCIEPYTCLPGGFSLQETGLDTGVRVLQPGESFEATVDLQVEQSEAG